MLTMRMSPKISDRPLASRNSSAPKDSPFSVCAIQNSIGALGSLPPGLWVLAQREALGPRVGDADVLFQPHRLLQAGESAEGLDGKVPVLLDRRGILEGVGARHPHAFVQGQPDAVGE